MAEGDPNESATRRLWIDTGLVAFLITLAFWTGVNYQMIRDIQARLVTRGAVPISIEADARLSTAEARLKELERRVDKLEDRISTMRREWSR